MHPKLSDQNNDDYSIKFEVSEDKVFGHVNLQDFPIVELNGISTYGCFGAMCLSELYNFDPATLTLKHKTDDFSYKMEPQQEINELAIMKLTSTFIKKDVQITKNAP